MLMQEAKRQLTDDLTPLYGAREASLIADWVLDHLTGRPKIDRLMTPFEPLTHPAAQQFQIYRTRLLDHVPIQYVLHESWFAGNRFYVDENVLIPRPETEELVDWALETISQISPVASADPDTRPTTDSVASSTPHPYAPAAILDVGTGSGCIAITLSLRLPTFPIHACDISEGALAVAARNARDLGARVTFRHFDFLDPQTWPAVPTVKWLVSNPPYIPRSEYSSLATHVADREPSLALFVPDADPLIFYHALGEFSRQHLLPGGALLAEIHESLAESVSKALMTAGALTVEVRKDRMGKDRMIKASWT
jgi:release factor glutamine methyltransferase